jgi:HPt (histidine-containing phosphotransfer) domain-containing protein
LTEEELPQVLDTDTFQALTDEVGEDVARAFLDEYLTMLPARAAKIFKGLAGNDLEPTLEAIISLKASSAMVGAFRLEAYCSDLERALKLGRAPDQGAIRAVLSANMRLVIREASRQGHLRNRPRDSDGS